MRNRGEKNTDTDRDELKEMVNEIVRHQKEFCERIGSERWWSDILVKKVKR